MEILNKHITKNIFQLEQEHVIDLMGGYYDWDIYITNLQDLNYIKYIHVRNKKVQPIDSLFILVNQMISKKDFKIPRVYTNFR